MLKDLNVDPGFNMEDLVRRTDGLSGSDLKESCQLPSLSLFRIDLVLIPVSSRAYLGRNAAMVSPVAPCLSQLSLHYSDPSHLVD